jgi:hypothetical protein
MRIFGFKNHDTERTGYCADVAVTISDPIFNEADEIFILRRIPQIEVPYGLPVTRILEKDVFAEVPGNTMDIFKRGLIPYAGNTLDL